MNRPASDVDVIRRVLLGQANKPETAQFQWRTSADPEYRELVDAVEAELVDDYARGAFSKPDRDAFERYYLVSDERRSKLREAEILHNATRTTRRSTTRRIAAAAALTFAAGFVVGTRFPWSHEPEQATVTLREGVRRGSGPYQTLELTPGTRLLVFRLEPDTPSRYTTVVLRDVSSSREVWWQTISALPGHAVPVELPAALLSDGDYYFRLEDSGQPVATFHFRVKHLP